MSSSSRPMAARRGSAWTATATRGSARMAQAWRSTRPTATTSFKTTAQDLRSRHFPAPSLNRAMAARAGGVQVGIGTLIFMASPSTHSTHSTPSVPRTAAWRCRPTGATLSLRRTEVFQPCSSILQLSSLACSTPRTVERRTIYYSRNELVTVPRSITHLIQVTSSILEMSRELLQAPAAPVASICLCHGDRDRRTPDGGRTWTNTRSHGFVSGDAGPWDATMVADPEDPLALYCGTTRVNRSLDGGLTWTPFEVRSYGPGESREEITSIAVSPVDSNRIYALTEHGKAFRSSDRGVSWTDIVRDSQRGTGPALLVAPEARTAFTLRLAARAAGTFFVRRTAERHGWISPAICRISL